MKYREMSQEKYDVLCNSYYPKERYIKCKECGTMVIPKNAEKLKLKYWNDSDGQWKFKIVEGVNIDIKVER